MPNDFLNRTNLGIVSPRAFGLADRQPNTGQPYPAYLSPEQAPEQTDSGKDSFQYRKSIVRPVSSARPKFSSVVSADNIFNRFSPIALGSPVVYPDADQIQRQSLQELVPLVPIRNWYAPFLNLMRHYPKGRARKDERDEWLAELNRGLINLLLAQHTDPLTGLWNRSFFDRQLDAQVSQATHRGEAMCISFIDLNDFKQYNEVFGHRAGDEALITFARVLKRSLPQGAYACRIGGDEFAVLFPNAQNGQMSRTFRQAQHYVQTVENNLQSTSVLINPDVRNPLRLYLAASIGVARINQPLDVESTYKQADSVLERAKEEKNNSERFREFNELVQQIAALEEGPQRAASIYRLRQMMAKPSPTYIAAETVS